MLTVLEKRTGKKPGAKKPKSKYGDISRTVAQKSVITILIKSFIVTPRPAINH
jgi:hypothetical protein